MKDALLSLSFFAKRRGWAEGHGYWLNYHPRISRVFGVAMYERESDQIRKILQR